MFDINIDLIIQNLQESIIGNVELYLPKAIGAFIILVLGLLIAVALYKIVLYIFKKFHLVQLIDRLTGDITTPEAIKQTDESEKKSQIQKLSDKLEIDVITAKSFSYYIFLVFFRLAVVFIGIKEVEQFLGDLLAYLPSLFVGIMIGFFGIRFANFIYDIVYHTLHLTKQKTGKIIASGAKIIILFFTFMLVLNYTKLVDPFIISTILVGFVSMLTLAGGLAFGLGGKDIAREILESFRK